MLKKLFAQKSKKPDPRFVDMEGYDATKKRNIAAHLSTPASMTAIGANTVLCGAIPLLIGFSGMRLVAALLLTAAFGAGVAYIAQRAKLRPLTALDDIAIDREGRHPLPEPKRLKQLWDELNQFDSDNKFQAAYAGLKIGLMTGVTGYAYTIGERGLCMVTALTAAAFLPHLAANVSAMNLCRKIKSKKYTFCQPPALSAVTWVNVESAKPAAARVHVK